jgi:hypothetical protein
MPQNPISSLMPKDPNTTSVGTELNERVKMQRLGEQALKPASAAPTKGTVEKQTPGPFTMDKSHAQGPYGTGAGEKRIDTSDMTKPLGAVPKMHDGGTVQHSGLHNLQKGEKVLTSEDHSKLKSAMALAHSALSHEPEKEAAPALPVHLKELHVKQLHTGGFHVQKHDGKGGMTEHGAPDNDSVVGHFMDHMAHPDEDEEAVEAGDHDMHAADAEHKAIGG